MNILTRLLVGVGIGFALSSGPVLAQSYPTKPIKLVSQYRDGATADKLARIAAEVLEAALGQTVTIEPISGGEGVPAAEAVAQSEPDGYTLLIAGASTQVVRKILVRNSSFDPVNDFTPIAILGESPAFLIAGPSLKAADFQELLADAKENPGKLKYGTPRIGSPNHLTGEQIGMMTGARMVHEPVGGQRQRLEALASGAVDTAFQVLIPTQKMVADGTGRPLVVIADSRVPELPDVPAITEVIPGFSPIHAWVALFAPAGLPEDIAKLLNNALHDGLAKPESTAKMAEAGYKQIKGSPADLEAMIAQDLKTIADVAKAANLQPQ